MRLCLVLVEGNIGSGKSTLLEHVTEPLRALLEQAGGNIQLCSVPEPVHRWQAPGNAAARTAERPSLNLLEAAYAQPQRYAFAMQTYAVVTRVDALLHAVAHSSSSATVLVLLCERSVYSDACVFARAAFFRGSLSLLEYRVYRDLFTSAVRVLDARDVALIVYVDTPPDVCAANMRRRQRREERAVNSGYLSMINTLHAARLSDTTTTTTTTPPLPLHAEEEQNIGQWPGGVPVLRVHEHQLMGITADASVARERAHDIYQALIASATFRHALE